jgi:acyl-CoA reductase-like NAD-dependent aldehyde dehydrogenase
VTDAPHIPVLRAGSDYDSLEKIELKDHRDGRVLARVSQANAGIVRRDCKRLAAAAQALRAVPVAKRFAICKEAGARFMEDRLPLAQRGALQGPGDYVAALSATSGLPHVLCRANMRKVFTVLDGMPDIVRGLTRGMDAGVLDGGFGEHAGIKVCYGPVTDALGVVLPSNSPGVNSIWMPAIALGVPVVLKPGREEPWTPLRIIRALLAAGCPREAFGFYPTDHEGSAAILAGSGRALLFGDESVTRQWAGNPAVQIHGPGRSKVVIGEDEIGRWREHLPVLVASIADNGGRSCINASSVFVPAHAAEIADALARELARIEPLAPDDERARLSAFANPAFAQAIDAAIERGLAEPGAQDVTAKHRTGPRACTVAGASFLRPTIVHCASLEQPLARTEYLFPFASVVEVPHAQLAQSLGPSLVVTAITRDRALIDALVRSPHIDRLNLGPVPTSRVEWDQPHEGNLFEFLYERRAIQRAEGW